MILGKQIPRQLGVQRLTRGDNQGEEICFQDTTDCLLRKKVPMEKELPERGIPGQSWRRAVLAVRGLGPQWSRGTSMYGESSGQNEGGAP